MDKWLVVKLECSGNVHLIIENIERIERMKYD